MHTKPPALQARSLFVPRGSRDVVSDVNLEVHAHSVVALIGPNGSGKTTLLKALAGLIPFRGSIEVQGRSLESLDRRQRAKQVAYVPQQSLLEAPMVVSDVVAQGRLAHASSFGHPSSVDRAAIEEAMAATDVEKFASRLFTSLSHGERHRVLIARGLATQAPVLLLDEPTAGLDMEHVLGLQNLLHVLARAGRAILVVLHPIAEVQSIAHRVAVLAGGQMVAFGPEPKVLTPSLIRDVYNVVAIPGGAWGFRTVDPVVQVSDEERLP
jgi:iron complex transport system ATP-binding protein